MDKTRGYLYPQIRHRLVIREHGIGHHPEMPYYDRSMWPMEQSIAQHARLMPARSVAVSRQSGSYLVFTALCFNMVLCFISTRGAIHMSNAVVIVCEMTIITAGLYAIRFLISDRAVRLSGVTAVFLIGLRFINPGLDLKILHDIAIMYIFYMLGTLASIHEGNRVLWIAMAIIIPIGLFEALFPTQFGAMFNVWSYYVDKGVISASTINYSHTTSFVSGSRGGTETRTFLPFLLGPTRFSSVFLEPVSMGNFSAIAFAWCLSTRIGSWKMRGLLVALAAACFVLADSRFAFGCWILMLALRMSPFWRSRFAVFCLPLLAMLGLVVAGSLHGLPGVVPGIVHDDFAGRLLFSGRLLDYWGLPQWFALEPSQVYTSDTGYAYVINNLGLPLALFLLSIFAFHRPQTPEAISMKAMIAVYMATSLCIGANMFTIKTAAICWFLYGAANVTSSTLARDTRQNNFKNNAHKW
jgi:putative polymerase